jgi:hypothetical protein
MLRKRSKEGILYFILIVSVGFLIYFLFLYFSVPAPVVSKVYETSFSVRPGMVGFDVNSTALTFGAIPPGGAGTRKLIVNNTEDYPVVVKIFASDEIADFYTAPVNITLGAGEGMKIPISVTVPEYVFEGNYSGNVKVEIHRL